MSTVLLLDNKDSFVWNLAQAFQILGEDVHVVRSDVVDPQAAQSSQADRIVISPGPGHPDEAGHSVEIIRRESGHRPVLGVCLGHQAIAVAFGGTIRRAPPCHGKPWPIHHEKRGLFADLPNPLEGCRYHSLAVDEDTLPDTLIVDARSAEGVVMSLRHRFHPTYGLQFHPESFRTPDGLLLLRNFLQATAAWVTTA